MILQGRAKYPVREAVLHTSATPGGWADGRSDEEILDSFWQWHVRENGWRKIGYHRILTPEGRVIHDNGRRLRSLYEVGAHVRERNRGTIGICLIPARTVPNVMKRGATFDDYYTPEQRQALTQYLRELAELTDLRWVTGHNDYAPKACPGFQVRSADWLPERAAA